MDCSPWNSPGQNTGMGSLSLLQGIFPTQGSNQGLLHCRWVLYQLSYECLRNYDDSFNYMVKAMAVDFLSYKVSSFVVEKCLGRDILRLCYYTVSLQCLPTNFSMDLPCNNYYCSFPSSDLVSPSFLPAYIN